MANAFSTDTAQSALEAYMSNSALDTIDDIVKAWELAGAELRSADETMKASRTVGGPLERVLRDAMAKAQQGIIDVADKKPGKKPADYKPTHVDRLVAGFLSMGDSDVTEGTGSHRNMLNTVQNVLMYAKKDESALATVDKAIAARDAARAADAKAKVNGSIVIMGNLAKASKKAEFKPLKSADIDAAVAKKAAPTKAWVDWVGKFLKDAADRPDVDEGEGWDKVVRTINAYITETREAAEAEAETAKFSATPIAKELKAKAKVHKNGTVAVTMTAEQAARLGLA